jgi:hypothetical protein
MLDCFRRTMVRRYSGRSVIAVLPSQHTVGDCNLALATSDDAARSGPGERATNDEAQRGIVGAPFRRAWPPGPKHFFSGGKACRRDSGLRGMVALGRGAAARLPTAMWALGGIGNVMVEGPCSLISTRPLLPLLPLLPPFFPTSSSPLPRFCAWDEPLSSFSGIASRPPPGSSKQAQAAPSPQQGLHTTKLFRLARARPASLPGLTSPL